MSALHLISNDDAYEPTTAGDTRMLLLLLAEHRAAVLNVARIEAEIQESGRRLIRARNPDHREFLRPTIERIRREVGAG